MPLPVEGSMCNFSVDLIFAFGMTDLNKKAFFLFFYHSLWFVSLNIREMRFSEKMAVQASNLDVERCPR
jgi:hypothetical protein